MRRSAVALSIVALAAGWWVVGGGHREAKAQGGTTWTSFQAGPEHLGVAAGAPPPALRGAWRWPAARPTDARSSASAPIIAGDVAVVVTVDQVVAVDAATGSLRWRLRRAPGALDAPAVDLRTGTLVFSQGRPPAGTSLIAVDLATRSQIWRFPPSGSLAKPLSGAPVISDGMVFAGGSDGKAYAIDAVSGEQRWSFRTGGTALPSPAAADGMVYVVGQDLASGRATLFGIDAATGKERWSYAPRGSVNASAPTVADGRVFEGFGDRTVRAFDATDGTLEWTGRVLGPFSPQNGLAYAAGAVYVLDATGAPTTAGATLYRFDSRTGTRAWDYQFEVLSVGGSPLLAGAFAYVGLDDGTIAAVDVRTGERVWATRLAGGSVGGLAAGDGVLLAPYAGRGGGLVGFRHSDDPLRPVESTTVPHPATALTNYAISFALTLALLLVVFRVVARTRSEPSTSPEPDRSGDGRGDGPDGGREAT